MGHRESPRARAHLALKQEGGGGDLTAPDLLTPRLHLDIDVALSLNLLQVQQAGWVSLRVHSRVCRAHGGVRGVGLCMSLLLTESFQLTHLREVVVEEPAASLVLAATFTLVPLPSEILLLNPAMGILSCSQSIHPPEERRRGRGREEVGE